MTETVSLWDDDPAAFVNAFNGSGDARRLHAQTTTRRRGGLERIAARASLSLCGMSLPELDRETRPSAAALEAAHAALRTVAGYDPDHAEEANGLGFAKGDVTLGHALASAPLGDLSRRPAFAVLVMRLAARYRRQVSAGSRFRQGISDQPDLFDA
jgi:hypothetical protein